CCADRPGAAKTVSQPTFTPAPRHPTTHPTTPRTPHVTTHRTPHPTTKIRHTLCYGFGRPKYFSLSCQPKLRLRGFSPRTHRVQLPAASPHYRRHCRDALRRHR